MAEAKHTPGPWRITRSDDLPSAIVAPDGDLGSVGIAKIVVLNDHEANAKLIAAAPDLYAAALAQERAENKHANCPDCDLFGDAIDLRQAALAKVRA